MKYQVRHKAALLSYLFEIFPDTSRTEVKEMLSTGRIAVNGARTKAFNLELNPGDTVELLTKGASIGASMKDNASDKVKKQGVDILFEDEHIMVVLKAPGLSTSAPTKDGKHIPANVCGILNEYVRTTRRAGIKAGTGDWKAPKRVYTLNRLDPNASGLLLIAKDERTRDIIMSRWDNIVLENRLTALLEGHVEEDHGSITTWISEDEKTGRVFSGTEEKDGGLKAITRWSVISRGRKHTLVEFEPETSRRHQLRIHAAIDMGHPIVGDTRYGSTLAFRGRLALHGGILVFRNPYSNDIQRFRIPAPAEMLKDSAKKDE